MQRAVWRLTDCSCHPLALHLFWVRVGCTAATLASTLAWCLRWRWTRSIAILALEWALSEHVAGAAAVPAAVQSQELLSRGRTTLTRLVAAPAVTSTGVATTRTEQCVGLGSRVVTLFAVRSSLVAHVAGRAIIRFGLILGLAGRLHIRRGDGLALLLRALTHLPLASVALGNGAELHRHRCGLWVAREATVAASRGVVRHHRR